MLNDDYMWDSTMQLYKPQICTTGAGNTGFDGLPPGPNNVTVIAVFLGDRKHQKHHATKGI